MSSPFIFAHPQLLTKGLVPDESPHYAFLTYDRVAMSSSAVSVMKSIQSSKLPVLNSKKRVKVIMEWFAVTLGLPIEHVSLMQIAIKQYLSWLENSEIFGDLKRQNKYLRRIITQMSLPFTFREPKDIDLFKGPFYTLLVDILNGMNTIHSIRGDDLEKETWSLIFHTMIILTDIVIKFDFGKFLPQNQISELRQLSTNVLFSVVLTSGIKEEKFWDLFNESTISWSGNIDFLKVWDEKIVTLFSFVNSRIYNEPKLLLSEKEPLQSGIYSYDHLIDTKTVIFLFTRFVQCLDFKQTITSPANFLEFNKTLSLLVKNAKGVASFHSAFSILKFPASSFLKLFGGMLTFAPTLSNEFDPAVSLNVDTLSTIISEFDPTGVENVLIKLSAYIVKKSTPTHPDVFSSFIKACPNLFGLNFVSTAGFAEFSMKSLAQFKSSIMNYELKSAITSLFISSSEVLLNISEIKQFVEPSFNRVWGVTEDNRFHYSLLCYASSRSIIPFLPRIQEVFNNYHSFLNLNTVENGKYVSSLISLLGASVRYHPDLITEVNSLNLLQSIVNGVISTDEKVESFSRLMISTCQLIIDFIDYTNAFTFEANIDAFFKFTLFLSKGIHEGRRKSSSNLLVGAWYEKNHHYIEALLSYITTRVNNHMASLDHITRRYGSSNELNEEKVMKSLNLEKINYFTVGKDLLVSFLETNDGKGDMAIFARGPFGKSIWKIKDDFLGSRAQPEKSNDCEPCELPQATKLNIEGLNLRGEEFSEAPSIELNTLEGFDEELRKKFGADFGKWLNWDVYGHYIPFGHCEPHQRPRVIDFLTTMGLVDAHNKLNIQSHKKEEIEPIIEKFDKLDNLSIKPVIVTLHLPRDENLEQPLERMTPLLEQFLREIGEPMDFKNNKDFPKVNNNVPTISSLNGLAVILTPAMGVDEEARKSIYDSIGSSLIRIIFNESGFDLKIDEEFHERQTVLVITPLGSSLYKVKQIHTYAEIISPFEQSMTVTANTLAFNIGMVLQMTNSLASKKAFPNIIKKRKSIISEICSDSNLIPEFGGVITSQFE